MENVSVVFVAILLHQAQIACHEVWEVAVEKGVMVDWHRIWHGFCVFEVWESLCNALQQLHIQQKQTTRKSGRITVQITMCCGRSSSRLVSSTEQLAGWHAGRRGPRESAFPMLDSGGYVSYFWRSYLVNGRHTKYFWWAKKCKVFTKHSLFFFGGGEVHVQILYC